MANLNFKWGSHEHLPEQKSVGTIYVTTDEQAMYIDVSENNRIRINGSIVYYNSIEEFTTTQKPPYDQNVLYFFKKIKDEEETYINALMYFDGTEWHQVNITREEFQEVKNAVTVVEANTAAIEEIREEIDLLNDFLGFGDGEEGGETGGGNALSQIIDTLNADLDKAQADIGALDAELKVVKDSKADISDVVFKADIEEINESLGKINESLEGKATIEDLEKKANTDDVDVKLALKADATTVEGIQGDIEEINENIEAVEENLGTVKTEAISAAEAKADEFKQDLQGQISNISTALDSKVDVESFEGLSAELTTSLENKILAVNALVYQGPAFELQTNLDTGVEEVKKILPDKAEAGWLYVVNMSYSEVIGESFEYYSPGDFIIATGTENADGLLSGKALKWLHIKTGYDSTFLQKLGVVSIDDNVNIQLKDFNNKPTTSVVIKSASDNLKITTNSDTNIIEFGLEWGSFDPPTQTPDSSDPES